MLSKMFEAVMSSSILDTVTSVLIFDARTSDCMCGIVTLCSIFVTLIFFSIFDSVISCITCRTIFHVVVSLLH